MRTFRITVSTLCLVVALAGSAVAGSIVATDLTPGVNNVNLGWATATSSPRNFDQKSMDSYTGAGVQGGFVDGEIDLQGESIRISFLQPTVISQITLGFLFPAGQYGDVVSEIASVKYSDNPWAAGYLSAIDALNATWSGAGSVTNLSQGAEPHAGVWRINNPFGNQAVNFVEFTAVPVSGGPGNSADSDFAFVSLDGNAVPEPSTWAMLGLGLSALLGSRKLRRKA